MEKQEILDMYFVDARCKLIELAAFMDRVERHGEESDFRYQAFKRVLGNLLEAKGGERACQVLEGFSDHSRQPARQAGMQGAVGAAKPSTGA